MTAVMRCCSAAVLPAGCAAPCGYVTIDRERATVRQVLDDFERQTDMRFELDARHIDDAVDRYGFATHHTAPDEALEEFMDLADLYVVEGNADRIRIARRVRVTYSFRNADLREVVEIICKTADSSYVIADLEGPITLSVTNRPWDAVLEHVLRHHTIIRRPNGLLCAAPGERLQREPVELEGATVAQVAFDMRDVAASDLIRTIARSAGLAARGLPDSIDGDARLSLNVIGTWPDVLEAVAWVGGYDVRIEDGAIECRRR